VGVRQCALLSASYSQLKQIVPNIDKLSMDLTWYTDSSNLTEMSTWAAGTSGGKTTSFNQNYSFESEISFAIKAGIGKVTTGGANFDIDLSGSFGFSSLNKSISELGKSTGIGVKKPGTFLDPPNYAYAVTSYIFGQIKPTGTVDNNNPTPADVQTFGLLRTAFVADPTRTGDLSELVQND
jgi:hypothetical protein